jgi:anti-sigma regulatory factor (Ser/Thr protein kinase)
MHAARVPARVPELCTAARGLSRSVPGHHRAVTEDEAGDRAGGSTRLLLRHPATPAEMRSIRVRVDRWARRHAVPEDAVIDLQLALGEAVANGVEHAYGEAGCTANGAATVDVELEIRPLGRTQVVAVWVADHGHWRPVPGAPGYRGRGLALIEQLSRGMQVFRTGSGTQVRFDIPLTR